VPDLPKTRYERLTVTVTPNQRKRLQQQAVARFTTVSQVLRESLERLGSEHNERHDDAAPTSLSAPATGGAERPLPRLDTGNHLI
jgi:hypothetical protein